MKLIIRLASITQASYSSSPLSSSAVMTSFEFPKIEDLEGVSNNLTVQETKIIQETALKLEKIAKIKRLDLSYENARKLLLVIRCNAHCILNAKDEAVALGLFPLTSMINHSCRPNCTHYFYLEQGKQPQMSPIIKETNHQ